MSLSRLKLAATFFHTESFDVWNRATDSWLSGFTGRVYVFDRFKTIYHRPTRRETLGITRETVLPADLVIRHTVTGAVYMVSATDRTDVDHVQVYDRARALHLTTTQGDLIRYATQGTGIDLGPLVAQDLGKCYYDLELRSETADQVEYAVQLGDMIGRYFLTVPDTAPIQKGDYIQGPDGTYYRLDVIYADSGFKLARAVDVAPLHEDIVYERPNSTPGGYDPATGVVTSVGRTDLTFSGYIGSLESAGQDVVVNVEYDLEIWVDKAHVGFEPAAGDFVRARGVRYHIDKVTIGYNGTKYQLLCRRATQ